MIRKTVVGGIISLFVIGGLVGIFSVIPNEVYAPGPTEISGLISENTTWTVDDSPYHIIDNTTLMKDYILTIEAGTIVKLANNTKLTIRGTLHVIGSSSNKVVFTALEPFYNYSSEYWDSNQSKTVYYNNSGSNYCVYINGNQGGIANISYAKFELSAHNHGALFCSSDPDHTSKVYDSEFINNKYGAKGGGGFTFNRCTFKKNKYGLKGEFYLVYNSIFLKNNYALSIKWSEVINCSILYNLYGLSVEDGSTLRYCIIAYNNIGVEGKWYELILKRNSIFNNTIGLLLTENEDSEFIIQENNIYNNTDFNLKLTSDEDTIAINNWWGTTNIIIIDQFIFDIYDDISLGEVIYNPFLTLPLNTSNQPPSISFIPMGPSSGIINISYYYSISATDPNGDQIKYGWDWDGDNIVDEWSSLLDSGTEDNRSHSWSIADIYNIKVKAQDEYGAESDWTDALAVTITLLPNNPPSIPTTPLGLSSGIINTSYSFSTSTTDLEGDQIKYGWDWDGDGTVDAWSDYIESGSMDVKQHIWTTIGTYNVKVKAIDEHGEESEWSETLEVRIEKESVESDADENNDIFVLLLYIMIVIIIVVVGIVFYKFKRK